MRITSGLAGGRRISVPKGIRPTQDRVREAYFSKVADMIAGCRFLDLFSGSGAVGIEAWSRGAAECLLVDQSRTVLKACASNIEELGAEGVHCACADAARYLDRPADRVYDLIYADPPYDAVDAGFVDDLFRRLRMNGWLGAQGIATLEHRAGGTAIVPEGWVLIDSRSYGESCLDLYVTAG